MFNLISLLGWICLAGGLIYYFLNIDDPNRIATTVLRSQTAIVVGAALIILGYILNFVGKKVGVRNRCKTCGKKIDKTEMYCFDHRREAIWKAQEKHRLEGSGKFNRIKKDK
jgi:hypothetical protein